MADTPRRKHVIFLGAGASLASGYPTAHELRRLLCSEREILDRVKHEGFKKLNAISELSAYLQQFKPAMELFRFGAFATVDEFCKLAAKANSFTEKVQQMRSLTRLVLALKNPETNYHDSDCYPFVQMLFDETLHKLRDDITVLTFNYDPHLERVLLRAVRERGRIIDQKPSDDQCNAVAGGFFEPGNWPRSTVSGFHLLKLHGSIGFAEHGLSHRHLFDSPIEERLESVYRQEYPPYIAFPWELFDENGEFCDAKKFPAIGVDGNAYNLFVTTWQRARAACQAAEKISFVGLSMHSFLDAVLPFYSRSAKTYRKKLSSRIVTRRSARDTLTQSRTPTLAL